MNQEKKIAEETRKWNLKMELYSTSLHQFIQNIWGRESIDHNDMNSIV